jgi:hypothetical protein
MNMNPRDEKGANRQVKTIRPGLFEAADGVRCEALRSDVGLHITDGVRNVLRFVNPYPESQ